MKLRQLRALTVPGPWLGAVLCVALLWAQALGLAHRSLHGPQPGGAAFVHRVAAAQGGAPGSPQHGLEALFGHDRGTPSCQLYDQLALGDFAVGGGIDAAPVLPPRSVAVLPPAVPRGTARLAYRARAPPLTIA
ncbi:hypothetical protein [Methylibium sp.]|uniref:hypothetical protein n=1 Tax=Methylibium sp. TaxID=2067992 RepID=UPI003D138975